MPRLPNPFSFLQTRYATKKDTTPTTQVELSGLGWRYGKQPTPSFGDLIAYSLTDPHVKAAIDELAESSVGHGCHFTCKDEQVLGEAQDFGEDIHLDEYNLSASRELWAAGNTLFEYVAPENLQNIIRIPIASVIKLYANSTGNITKFDLNTGTGQKSYNIEKRFKFMQFNCLDTVFVGRGLLEPLMRCGLGYTWIDASGVTHQSYRPSVQQSVEEMEDSMRKAVRKYIPKYILKAWGMSTDEFNGVKSELEKLAPEEDFLIRLGKNKDVANFETERLSTDPRSKLEPFIEYYDNMRTIALETPTLRLFLEAGFTEASARTAVLVLDRKIAAFQRFLKRNIEQHIMKPKIMQLHKWTAGNLADEQAFKALDLRLNWGQLQTPTVDINAIIQLAQISATTGVIYITPEEVRNALTKTGFSLDKLPTTSVTKVETKIEKPEVMVNSK